MRQLFSGGLSLLMLIGSATASSQAVSAADRDFTFDRWSDVVSKDIDVGPFGGIGLDFLEAIRNRRRGAPNCYCLSETSNLPATAPPYAIGIPLAVGRCENEQCFLRIQCVVPFFDQVDERPVIFRGLQSCVEFAFFPQTR